MISCKPGDFPSKERPEALNINAFIVKLDAMKSGKTDIHLHEDLAYYCRSCK